MTKLPIDRVHLDDILRKFSVLGRYHVLTMLFVALVNASNSIYYSNYIFVAEAVSYRCGKMTKLPIDRVHLDDILRKFSVLGRYHVLTMLFVALVNASNSIYHSNYIFVAQAVSYRCKDNRSYDGPLDAPASSQQMGCSGSNGSRCTEWLYDNPNSFVAEFNLACQEWKRTLVGTMHSFGYMVGLLFVGPLSDRLGRKSLVVITGVLGAMCGLARSFTTNYWLYLALEFLEAFIGDPCSPLYMLAIEAVATEKRVVFMTICGFGYIVGGILFPTIAWLIPYWRTLLQVVYTPGLLIGFYIFFIDESPRWLLTKGKKDAAMNIIEKAAKLNKLKLDADHLDRITYEEVKGAGFVAVVKETLNSRPILKRFFVCSSWWIASTFVNHGLTINSVSLQGNKYVNYGLTSVVDVPGSLIVAYILMKFKRKVPLIMTFVACSILCVAQPFIPLELPWLSVSVYMAGKLMASFYFTITYIFTSELFPTYTRNSMHALCSSVGRIGSLVAPQTPLLLVYWSGLPPFIFGIVSLTAGLLTFLVPDTAESSLPDTVGQAEALGSKHDKLDMQLKRKESSQL